MTETDARDVAAEYIATIINDAYDNLTLDEIETAFEVDTGKAMSILYAIGSMRIIAEWEDGCTCEDGDEDAVELGDPDPTNYGEDYDCCDAKAGPWSCTRREGHSGQHVAGDGSEVCAVWE